MASDKFIHPDYRNNLDLQEALARLPPNCTIVIDPTSEIPSQQWHVAHLETSAKTPKEAVDQFLARLHAKWNF